MDKRTVFQCAKCGKTVDALGKADEQMLCCGKPMKNITKLPDCQSSVTAEQDRFTDEDEPCDSGVK